MNEYICYIEGRTTEFPIKTPSDQRIQMLGRAYGRNVKEAKERLLAENPWILKTDINISNIFIEQTLTNEQRSDIRAIIDYLWKDEERHYEESERPLNHIFNIMKRLKVLCVARE